MPTYEFRCRECAQVFEKFMRMSAKNPPLSCAFCGSHSVDRVVLSSTFQLKGGGWAADGYHKNVSVASSSD